MEEERLKLLELQEKLMRMGEVIRNAYAQTFEIEAAEVATPDSIEEFTEQFNKLIAEIGNRAKSAGVAVAEESQAAAIAEKDTALADLTAKLESETNSRVFAERKYALASVFTAEELEQRKDQLLAFTPDAFNLYAKDLITTASKKTATASERIEVPNFRGNHTAKIDDIVNAFNTKESK
jgi:hypothetical protein